MLKKRRKSCKGAVLTQRMLDMSEYSLAWRSGGWGVGMTQGGQNNNYALFIGAQRPTVQYDILAEHSPPTNSTKRIFLTHRLLFY